MLVTIGWIALDEYADNPQVLGITDVSFLLEEKTPVESEFETFKEKLVILQ